MCSQMKILKIGAYAPTCMNLQAYVHVRSFSWVSHWSMCVCSSMFSIACIPFCVARCRWNTLAWPRKVVDQIESTEQQLEQDEQRFQKKLLDDQTQLDDKLDTLQVHTHEEYIVL